MSILKDIIKTAAPAVAGYFLGPAAGGLLGSVGVTNPAIQKILGGALTSGLGSAVLGGSGRENIRAALLGGLGGAGSQFMDTRAAEQATAEAARQKAVAEAASRGGVTNRAMEAAVSGTEPVKAATDTAKLLEAINMAGSPEERNLLFNILNTRLGEGLAYGLGAQALDALFSEEEDTRGSFERRPYGAGGPGGQLGGIQYRADGGPSDPMYFPRRTGGIDPSLGSGRKDDVPAMLMAGEFVMTRDAVKGAGNGDLRKGINKMYNMMDSFERMA